MKKILLVKFLIVLLCTSLFSETLLVEYTEGYVEERFDGEWYELIAGDELEDDAVLRLEADSYAEIHSEMGMIRLMKPGTYMMSDLVKSLSVQSSVKKGSLLGGRLEKMVSDSDEITATAVGGVRASEAVDDFSIDWMGGEDTDELISQGIEHLTSGEFAAALSVFEEAYDFCEEWEEGRVLFHIGYTQALKGNFSDSLKTLQDLEPEAEDDYFIDYKLVLSQLYLDSFAYDDALAVLEGFTAVVTDPSALQTAHLVRGIALYNIGNFRNSEAELKKAISLIPDSEEAILAGEYLQLLGAI
jgi:tetratricopeptide (TPR) repeat protein